LSQVSLNRTLSLPVLVLYGLGTTIGAGIYALTGEIARTAGMLTFLSFAFAALLAGLSAASFAALASRYPEAAAEAVYVREGFGSRTAARWIGLSVVAAGSVSAATIANGFVGYLAEVVAIPRALALIGLLTLLGSVAAIGVKHSVAVASAITVAEIGGLLLIVTRALPELGALPDRLAEFSLDQTPGGIAGVLGGSFLAFYAFLGFEDMVNVAEEVRDAPRVVPIAIALTLAATVAIYALVALAAVLAVSPQELADSEAPLALVYERTGGDARTIAWIGVIAMINGALIQIIMASRVLFGLARDGEIPPLLARVNPLTRTPIVATVAVAAVVAGLALAFPLARLAESTSLITLGIFAAVNASLLRIQARDPAPEGVLRVPSILPWAGLVVSLGFLAMRLAELAGLSLRP